MSRVKIDITGNASGFNDAMKGVEHSVNQIKGLIAVQLVAEGVEALEQLAEKTLEFGANLVDTARKVGLTVEQVQVLKKVAEESGTEFEALTKAIGKVAIARQAALQGNKEDIAKFAAFGVNTATLKNNNSGDILFKSIGDKIKSSSFDAVAKPLADILGKNFQEVIPALRASVDDTKKSMESLGEIMDTKTAVELKVLQTEFKTLSNILITVFAPALIYSIKQFETAVDGILHFIFPNSKEEGTFHKAARTGVTDLALRSVLGNNLGGALAPLATTGESILADTKNPAGKFDAFLKEQDENIAKLLKELDGNGKVDNTPITPNKKVSRSEGGNKGFYSDSLTASGNLLGASFNNAGSVATQLQLQRDANAELKQVNKNLDLIYGKSNRGDFPNIFGAFE